MMIADFLNTTLLLHHRDGNVLTVDVPVLGVALDCIETELVSQNDTAQELGVLVADLIMSVLSYGLLGAIIGR